MVRTILKKMFKRFKTADKLYSSFVLFLECGLNPQKYYIISKFRPYSQLSITRLWHLYTLARQVEKDKIRGNFVECGVWRGGTAAVLAFVAQEAKSHRQIWLLDSFMGMPEPLEIDGQKAVLWAKGRKNGRLVPIRENCAEIENVRKLFFKEFHFHKDNIIFQKGWVQETLPACRNTIDEIAILHIDVDWYEATKCCLHQLYDQVVRGGYVIIDDYNYFVGCKIAVDEFIKSKDLNIQLIPVDEEAVYFKKP